MVRPLHRPLTRALRRRLGRNYAEHPEMQLPPPYEAVQFDVERNLHHYLHVRPADIRQVVIVGMHEGDETGRLQRSYPNARILGFEPHPETFQLLRRNFSHLTTVEVRCLALAAKQGKTTF